MKSGKSARDHRTELLRESSPTCAVRLVVFGFLVVILVNFGCAKRTRLPRAAACPPICVPLISCDDGLWQHVYAGRFQSPKDRLRVIQPCITVTGTIASASKETDGDFHVRLAVDPQFRNLLNARNISGQHGHLVLEPVCENAVTQPDTIRERVCEGFSQDVFTRDMIGRHVAVTGAFVTDMEHGWNEIHPVSSIVVQ